MLEFLAQYWHLALLMIAVLILTFFLWVKAAKSSAERNREKKEFIAKLEREKSLRERFAEITTDVIEKEPLEDIFEGVVANIQRRLDKSEDMLAAFDAMNDSMKYTYAAYYVFDDSKDGLSEFFKKNGRPLTPLAPKAVSTIFGDEIGAVVQEQWEIFDEENEGKSVISEEYEPVNKKFKNTTQNLNINEVFKNYVIQNIGDFA